MSAPAAVVVAWRAGERAATCLDRLAEAAPGVARVLVDGESDPDALARLLASRPGVEAVPLAHNPGFAGGANAGVERAFAQGASHALLLNDDVLVEPGCVEALVAAAGEAPLHRSGARRRTTPSRAPRSTGAAASAATSTARPTT